MPHRTPSIHRALPVFVLGAGLLAGCAPTAPREPAPRLDARTVVGVRGIPNGRSDDAVPYFAGQPIPVSTDPGFGYSADKAVRLGPLGTGDHLRYLASLRGPSGEPVAYERMGACCRFEDPALPLGAGMIDVYAITPDGARTPLRLYIDMYRLGPLLLPQGFTLRPTEEDP